MIVTNRKKKNITLFSFIVKCGCDCCFRRVLVHSRLSGNISISSQTLQRSYCVSPFSCLSTIFIYFLYFFQKTARGSFFKCLWRPELRQAEARSLGVHLGLPGGWRTQAPAGSQAVHRQRAQRGLEPRNLHTGNESLNLPLFYCINPHPRILLLCRNRRKQRENQLGFTNWCGLWPALFPLCHGFHWVDMSLFQNLQVLVFPAL